MKRTHTDHESTIIHRHNYVLYSIMLLKLKYQKSKTSLSLSLPLFLTHSLSLPSSICPSFFTDLSFFVYLIVRLLLCNVSVPLLLCTTSIFQKLFLILNCDFIFREFHSELLMRDYMGVLWACTELSAVRSFLFNCFCRYINFYSMFTSFSFTSVFLYLLFRRTIWFFIVN